MASATPTAQPAPTTRPEAAERCPDPAVVAGLLLPPLPPPPVALVCRVVQPPAPSLALRAVTTVSLVEVATAELSVVLDVRFSDALQSPLPSGHTVASRTVDEYTVLVQVLVQTVVTTVVVVAPDDVDVVVVSGAVLVLVTVFVGATVATTTSVTGATDVVTA